MLYYYVVEECDWYVMYGFFFIKYRDRVKERRDKYGIFFFLEFRYKRLDFFVS